MSKPLSRQRKQRLRQKRKDADFLANLREELRTQPTSMQPNPRFWVIKDYKYEIVKDGYGDTQQVRDCESSWSTSEFINYVREEYADYINIEDEHPNVEEVIDDVNKLLDSTGYSSEYELFDVGRFSYVVPNLMFISRAEAVEHLEKCAERYADDAHIYAMTATQSPKMSRLIKILKNR